MTVGEAGSPVLVMLAGGLAKRYGGCKPLAPLGLHGEAVIDLNASDGTAAGFGEIVVVVSPLTGPAISYHVTRCWPSSVKVTLVEQPVALGTAHAALCAHDAVGDRPFALVNADDVYGLPALRQLVAHLRRSEEQVMVAYRLVDTIVSGDPVTRGTCDISPEGTLRGIVERRMITRLDDGRFTAGDGRLPADLAADTPVSVNLWGFTSTIWPVLLGAVQDVHPGVRADGTRGGTGSGAANGSGTEVLLPEVVGDMVSGAGRAAGGGTVRVLHSQERCIGVTHADDLPVARGELAVMVGEGLRGEALWRPVG